MPAQNKTALLKLNQWLENEYPKMIDFNEDNLAIENAIKEVKDSLNNLDYVDSVTLSGNEILIVKKGVINRIQLPKGFSGSWNDLVDKPINFPTEWEKVKNKPNLVTKETFDTNIQSINQNIAKKANRDEVDENMRDLTIRQEQLEADMGNKNFLQTNNTTNLVSAINEVFQLGTDRGNVIKTKIGALTGKTMQNMGDVANELEKYDVESGYYKLANQPTYKNKALHHYGRIAEIPNCDWCASTNQPFVYNKKTNEVKEIRNTVSTLDLSHKLSVSYQRVVIDFDLMRKYTFPASIGNDFDHGYQSYDDYFLFNKLSYKFEIYSVKKGRIYNLKAENEGAFTDRYYIDVDGYSTYQINVYDRNDFSLIKAIKLDDSAHSVYTLSSNLMAILNYGDTVSIYRISDGKKLYGYTTVKDATGFYSRLYGAPSKVIFHKEAIGTGDSFYLAIDENGKSFKIENWNNPNSEDVAQVFNDLSLIATNKAVYKKSALLKLKEVKS